MKRNASSLKYYLYDNTTREFTAIRDGFVCGREDSDLRFADDDLISRRHCRFVIRGNDIYIEDLLSTNRTRVNTVPIIPNKRRRIQLHDVIELGSQRLILTSQDRHQPANVEDLLAARAPALKGLRKEDGSITRNLSKYVTRRTRILLDRSAYGRLGFRKKASRFLRWLRDQIPRRSA